MKVDEKEPDKSATIGRVILKRTMGSRATGCVAFYRILKVVWHYLVSPFLPLTDVVTDIITVTT